MDMAPVMPAPLTTNARVIVLFVRRCRESRPRLCGMQSGEADAPAILAAGRCVHAVTLGAKFAPNRERAA